MTGARVAVVLGLALLAAPVAGCGKNGDEEPKPARAFDGTYVGKLKDTDMFVAVVAAPAAKPADKRDTTIYVCDAKRICAWFTGSAPANSFSATSEDGDVEAKGKLSDTAATGTVKLSDGKTVGYEAQRAAAAAGLYRLKVSSKGELSGASAAGVALKGTSTLPKPGTGTLKLADGTSLKFTITEATDADSIPLRGGQVRMIVLPGGELRGAGKTGGGAAEAAFFIRSSSGGK